MSERIGRYIGNYQLVKLLGRGGFAEVYLAEQIYLKTQAAIKLVLHQLEQEDLDAFLTEARIIANLTHPNIVRVLEFGEHENTPYLVMDYATAGTLRNQHPVGSRLAVAQVVSYVRQVAAALQYAHDHKIIHRDVKPENMLAGRHGEILLSDFGIAVVSHSSHSQRGLDVVGTIAYMAPEQLQGKVSMASDQYALGIVVYEWLIGRPPFNGSIAEIASQHLFAPPPSVREKIPSIAAEIDHVLQMALAKDPHQRYASIQAFANALERASLTTGASSENTSTYVNQDVVLIPRKTPVFSSDTLGRASAPTELFSMQQKIAQASPPFFPSGRQKGPARSHRGYLTVIGVLVVLFIVVLFIGGSFRSFFAFNTAGSAIGNLATSDPRTAMAVPFPTVPHSTGSTAMPTLPPIVPTETGESTTSSPTVALTPTPTPTPTLSPTPTSTPSPTPTPTPSPTPTPTPSPTPTPTPRHIPTPPPPPPLPPG